MIKKILFLSSLFITSVITIKAQQDPLLTHFIYNKMQFNPGSTGLDQGFSATAIYRNQWGRIDGAPNSSIVNLEGNMNRFFPGGLGLNFYSDQIGFFKQNNLMLNYSYPLMLGGNVLGIGIGVGMQNFGVNPTWITPDQSTAGKADKSLPLSGFSATGLDFNFGLYFKSNKGFYIGASATHLNAPELQKKNENGNYKVSMHAYFMAGYSTKPIGPGTIDAQMMVRSDLKKQSLDFNARYILNNTMKIYGGLTYRTSDCLALMLGLNPYKNLTVGYSYDYTLSKLTSVSRGSHEILLKYCYYLPVPPVTVSRNPRWL